MKEIELSPWSDDENNIDKIFVISGYIKKFNKTLPNIFNLSDFNILLRNIENVLLYWVGSTYVGKKKKERVKKAFQQFFENMYEFFWKLQDCSIKEYSDFAKNVFYQGKVYRYLGHGNSCDNEINNYVTPIYDGIYVSWSKNNHSDYLESKLYGNITFLECDIKDTFYGIDLDFLGVGRPNEAEVIFPTIKECITGITYLNFK